MAKHRGRFLFVTFAFLVIAATSQAQTVLEVRAVTDRPQYMQGQPVMASVIACNLTDATVIAYVEPPCDLDQFRVFEDDTDPPVAFSDFGPWCVPVAVPVPFEPGECRVIGTWEWHQRSGGCPNGNDGTPVDPGAYTLAATFLDTTTEPTGFEILARRGRGIHRVLPGQDR